MNAEAKMKLIELFDAIYFALEEAGVDSEQLEAVEETISELEEVL